MQYDMHYYGTYAMAAAAGIPKEDAEVIANSAQFVDDQDFERWAIAKSGEGIFGIATAHHPLEAGLRVGERAENKDDSRAVWLPFHFLPGNKGSSFEERLIARKDSAVANAMLDYYLKPETLAAHQSHALHLFGIAAHVYADTFSHYGFSGISSDRNLIKTDSLQPDPSHSEGILQHIKEQADRFWAKVTSAPKLGHGAVLTFPDRPYLRWSFEYQNGEPSKRINAETFVEACEALHRRFTQFAGVYYGKNALAPVAWQTIQGTVSAIIKKEGAGDERVGFWMDAMSSGALPGVTRPREYRAEEWSNEISEFESGVGGQKFISSNPYKFFSAADYHRSYVLKRLLPSLGLMVG
jgi:Family of unknown function (DUF6765)